MSLPRATKKLRLRDLVMYCGAFRDFDELHYDRDVAMARGFSGPVVPGLLTTALLTKVLTDWIGPEGIVKRVNAKYRRAHVAGETLTLLGEVTAKRIEDGEHLVECSIWAENGEGEITTPGTAVLVLPPRG